MNAGTGIILARVAFAAFIGGYSVAWAFNSAVDQCAGRTNNRGLCDALMMDGVRNAVHNFFHPRAGAFVIQGFEYRRSNPMPRPRTFDTHPSVV